MGISKSSFYDTFGGKRDLYLKTLDYYIENNNERIGSILNEEGPPLDLIDRWLQQAIDGLVSGDVRRGCFLNNCAVEDGPHDPEVAAKAREGFYAVKRKLAAIIACGQVSGDNCHHKSNPTRRFWSMRSMASRRWKVRPRSRAPRRRQGLVLSALDRD